MEISKAENSGLLANDNPMAVPEQPDMSPSKIYEILAQMGNDKPSMFGYKAGLRRFIDELATKSILPVQYWENITDNAHQQTTSTYILKIFTLDLPSRQEKDFEEIVKTMARCGFHEAISFIKQNRTDEHTRANWFLAAWCGELDELLSQAPAFIPPESINNSSAKYTAAIVSIVAIIAIVALAVLLFESKQSTPTPTTNPVKTTTYVSPPARILSFSGTDFASLDNQHFLFVDGKTGNVSIANRLGNIVQPNLIAPRGMYSIAGIAFNIKNNILAVMSCKTLRQYSPSWTCHLKLPFFCYCGCAKLECPIYQCIIEYYNRTDTTFNYWTYDVWDYTHNEHASILRLEEIEVLDNCRFFMCNIIAITSGTTDVIYFVSNATDSIRIPYHFDSQVIQYHEIYGYNPLIPVIPNSTYLNDVCFDTGEPVLKCHEVKTEYDIWYDNGVDARLMLHNHLKLPSSINKPATLSNNDQLNPLIADIAVTNNTGKAWVGSYNEIFAYLQNSPFTIGVFQIKESDIKAEAYNGNVQSDVAHPPAEYYSSLTFLNDSWIMISTHNPHGAQLKNIVSHFICWCLKFDKPPQKLMFFQELLFVGFGAEHQSEMYTGPFCCM